MRMPFASAPVVVAAGLGLLAGTAAGDKAVRPPAGAASSPAVPNTTVKPTVRRSAAEKKLATPAPAPKTEQPAEDPFERELWRVKDVG